MTEMSGTWKKSSYSNATGCVEVRRTDSGVQVRDSKNRSGPVLDFNDNEWNAFLNGVANGEFVIAEAFGNY